MSILGVILAGGRATRMGGGDKGLLPLGAGCVLDVVLARVCSQVDALVINANGDPARFARFGLPVVADSLPDHPGPLAGVLAGLDWAAQRGHADVLSIAADTPFFPADLAARLLAGRAQAGTAMAMAAVPGEGGRVLRQPTFALWPVALAGPLRAALGADVRKIVAFTHAQGCADVVFTEQHPDPFFNVNTPEDLATAQAYIGSGT